MKEYVGETGRTLKKLLSEHNNRWDDQKNEIAVHVMNKSLTINWEEANIRLQRWATREEEYMKTSGSRDSQTP